MTVETLNDKFNFLYGLYNNWPKTYEVDYETYANVCQFIFDSTKIEDFANMIGKEDVLWRTIALGLNNGIMFKNVELILKKS